MVSRFGSAGFTLIEVMIVVVIIAILAGIAFPSYQSHVHRSRCNLAQADLVELTQFMERRFSTTFDYRQGGANPTLPFNASPRDGTAAFTIDFQDAVTQNAFTLRATPVAGMVDAVNCGDAVDASGDPSNVLTIDQQGTRSW